MTRDFVSKEVICCPFFLIHSKTLNGENLPKISPLVPRTLYLLLPSLVVMEPLTFQALGDMLMGVSLD